MPDEQQPEITPEQIAYRQRMGAMIPVMAEETRAIVGRYVGIYGMDFETATWSIYSALLTTLDKILPQNQLAVMTAITNAMDKRRRALSGEKPAEAAPPKPDAKEPEDETEA